MTTALPAVVSATTLPADCEETDVLVIGFGIAGGCAALEAARSGARVILLERAATYGGTSAMSGGHFYLGGGTAVQQATGHEDSAEEMYKYLVAVSEEPEPDKIRVFCDDSVDHFNWVEALGFQFERTYFPGKAVIQPGTEGLMFTGNEKVHPYRDAAKPAPRGHKVPVPGDTGGTQMVMDLLNERIKEAGVEVRYEVGATNLVVDESTGDPEVVGVAWKKFAETGFLKAKAVIVAAGGFVMNPDMVAENTPALGEKLFVLGNTYDDGLGLRLGKSVGAQLKFMDEPFITAPFYPPSQLVTGIVVNKDGKRFVTEDSYHSRTSYHVMQQPDQAAYLIVDSAHIEHPSMPLCPFIDGWETIEEMESALGIPTGNLVETLANYHANAHQGVDPELHKHPDWIAPQDQGPWGAYDLTLGKALYAGFTLGGMRCTKDGEVQREDGALIAGLYAAGACAANIAQTGASYASGTQLAEGSYFGRRAGRHAASLAS
jgi:3-oxo-5alpha-steroid 4-dehydrogenase